MIKIVAVSLLFALPGASAPAQESPSTTASPTSNEAQAKNSVTLVANVGVAWNVSSFGSSVEGLDRSGPAANVRMMWRSKYLLSYGFEVGYTARFSVSSTAGGSTIDATSGAVPILVVFSMSPTRGLFVNMGLGGVISTSTVSATGGSASSSAFGSGFLLSVSYLRPVSTRFNLGGELRFFRADTYADNILALQFSVAYRLSAQ